MPKYSVTIQSNPGCDITWATGVDKFGTLRVMSRLLDQMAEDPKVWGGDIIVTLDEEPLIESAGTPCLNAGESP